MLNRRATHILIRHNEISLKGKNRPEFERRLCQSLSRALGDGSSVENLSGRFVVPMKELKPEILSRLASVGGVVAITPCTVVEPKPQCIEEAALEWAKDDLQSRPEAKTFAVRTRRVDKRFPLSSMEADTRIGKALRALNPGLAVNLKNPDLKLNVEIRHKHALIYSWEQEGAHGLPMDTTQRVVCLLSGGIDSPVAAYEIMRRGCAPVLVHFHSKPFTSEASVTKVKRLASILRQHSPYPLELWLIPLLEIQKAVRDVCHEKNRTIHYRRFMMKLAQELANRRGAKALVTGDALGQVASQTLTNLSVIESEIQIPVLRPLIALDKAEIIEKAKKLKTYETSIEPHDDTCVLFAPNHPATQARLAQIEAEQALLASYELVFKSVDAAEKYLL